MEIAGIIIGGINLLLLIVLLSKKSDISVLQQEIENNKLEMLNNITSLQEQIQIQADGIKQETLNNMISLQEQLEEQSEEIQLIQHSCTLNSEQILALLNYKDPNLDPDASHWILENEKFKKIFTPGKLEKVTYDNGTTELHYEYDNENIICSKYVDGILKTKTILNQFSVPIKGYLYDTDGNIINEFVYDSLGQLTLK